MSDRVTPLAQLLETILARLVANVQVSDLGPEVQTEAVEIRAEVARVRIALIEFPILDKGLPTNILQRTQREGTHEVIRTFGMEVTAIALKVRRQQDRVSLDHLPSRVP